MTHTHLTICIILNYFSVDKYDITNSTHTYLCKFLFKEPEKITWETNIKENTKENKVAANIL